MARARTVIESTQVIGRVLRMIARHRGKPCPSRADIIAWTGLPRRDVWPFLRSLAECEPPLIEIEERLHARAGMRRMRLVGGPWTGWTERKTPSRKDHAPKRRAKLRPRLRPRRQREGEASRGQA
jgi:hypothetical protein